MTFIYKITDGKSHTVRVYISNSLLKSHMKHFSAIVLLKHKLQSNRDGSNTVNESHSDTDPVNLVTGGTVSQILLLKR